MGLFTGYVIYKAGKRRAMREAEAAVEVDPTCDLCGHRLSQHSRDARRLCPTYGN
jgi:hypothetical protein